MPDTKRYEIHQKEWEKWYESVCKRCGKCCGANSDPCKNLKKLKDGTYLCNVYPNRLEEQETISGKKFSCVPIRQVIKYKDVFPNCAYLNLKVQRK